MHCPWSMRCHNVHKIRDEGGITSTCRPMVGARRDGLDSRVAAGARSPQRDGNVFGARPVAARMYCVVASGMVIRMAGILAGEERGPVLRTVVVPLLVIESMSRLGVLRDLLRSAALAVDPEKERESRTAVAQPTVGSVHANWPKSGKADVEQVREERCSWPAQGVFGATSAGTQIEIFRRGFRRSHISCPTSLAPTAVLLLATRRKIADRLRRRNQGPSTRLSKYRSLWYFRTRSRVMLAPRSPPPQTRSRTSLGDMRTAGSLPGLGALLQQIHRSDLEHC